MSMPSEHSVDAALNIFAKPYQTALSALSLLRCCYRHIDSVYLRFEPRGSKFDQALPYAIASYAGERAIVHQPECWLKRDIVGAVLEKHFPGFVEWCRKQGNNMFAD
jgi:hypothetical protein